MSRVSYAMMHPEGAGEMTAAVRKALDGLIASLAMRAGIKRAEILELAIVGNPIMHHLLLGIDPTPLGWRAVRARHGPGGPHDRRRARAPRPPGRPRLRPAVHRRPRRRRHGRRDPRRAAAPGRADDARRRRRHERRDRARRQAPAACRLEPDRPGLRGRPDLAAASARRRAPSSASASTARRSSRGSGSSASTPWSDEPAFATGDRRDRRSPASAARGSSRSSPSCSWPGSSPRTASSTATGGTDAARSSPTAGRSATSSTRATGRRGPAHRDHPERRPGDPARPRPRSTPASGC